MSGVEHLVMFVELRKALIVEVFVMGKRMGDSLFHTQAMDKGMVESKETDGEMTFGSFEESPQVEYFEARMG